VSSADVRTLLDLKADFRTTAFRAVEAILREDPVLAGVVKTWRSREGHDDDLSVPATGMMPLIGLSPLPTPNAVDSIDEIKVRFEVSVQLFVEGTCVDDILNLWGAVEDAVVRTKPFHPEVPGQEDVGRYLCSIFSPGPRGVIRLWASEPAFFPVDLAKPNNNRAYQWGVGKLSSFLLRPA
jgi:hypothetical protein